MGIFRYPPATALRLSAGAALAWKLLVAIASVHVASVATFGFLLGQALLDFSLASSIAGIVGLIAAVAGFAVVLLNKAASIALYSALGALVGVAADVGAYYLGPQHVGNYYAWELVAPFAIGLGVIGCAGWLARGRLK